MIKRFFILLLAIVASVGMMNAKVTWNSSNISDLQVMNPYQPYSKEGVTLSANSDMIEAMWQGYGDESHTGIYFNTHATGGFTFSNTLGKNFTKIVMTVNGPAGWDFANLGSGWSFYWDYTENPATVTWTGNASTVDLLKEASDFGGEQVKSIVFYFVGDSEAPDPTYTVALKAGTANADKVTLSATSAVEGATVTVTPNEEYEITAFSAYYVVVNGQLGSINTIDATLNAETGAYSFTMPAYDVTIEATIALKPVPEGDIFAGFTATAGSGGFDNEGSANLVDNKFISSDWTKWCANDGHKSVPTGESESCWWIDFEASAALNLTGYILTTGNDSGSEHGRNPKNWVLKAKLNAGDAWTTIATVTNDVTMKNKSFKDYKFFVDQSGSYKYFRFEVFANQGASVMQLCQLRLIGTGAPASGSTPAGALNGAFTINADGDQIVFSKGNLQATTTNLGSTWTWDFAPNQWSLIGDAVANNAINGNKTVSANGTVDLFGWSTAATYYGINKSWNNDDYAGDFVDWGALMGTEWRTLSRAEFRYIVFDRAQAFNKQGKATVNGVSGYIFLPDAWTLPSGLSFTPSPGDYTTNQYDGANWEAMEAAGAVFLPAAGDRSGTDIYMYDYGWYWTSTSTEDSKAYYLYFYKVGRDFVEHNRYDAKSVRLVTEAPIPPYEAAIKLINAIGTVELTAECKAKIDAARAAFDALSTEDKALVTNYTTLTTAEAAFENVMNIWLSGDCDAILWKDTTLTIRKHAGEGNGAMADYDYMDRAPWYSNHWYDPQPSDIVIKSVTIEEGVTHLGDYAFAWMSEMKTATIPSSVTTIPEDAFYWSKAVDDIYLTVADPANLTWALPYSADAQFKPSKATLCHVPADLLTAYQEKFDALNMTFVGDLNPATPLTPEQQQALDAVKGLINAIPSPVVYTPACKDAIDAARAAYDALTPDMLKQLVSNYATLTAAEATYANLKDVVEVEAKINNIPQQVTLKLATRDSIESARAAYDALTADQQALVSNYPVLTAAEAALAGLNPGGGMPAGALNGKFTINADGDQISFAKGNLQATTEDLGANWTWGFAANQWNYLGIAVANNAISGNGTVSENGTVDLFGWSTAATYYGINNSYKAVDYIGDFVDWGPNMGAGWRTLTKDEWAYLLQHSSNGKATVNDKNGYIFLPNDWSGPDFTPDPDNFTTNVYSGDDWTAMENAGAVFLPSGPARNGKSALIAMDAKYSSSTSLNNDTSYVFTIYYNQSQSACTGTNRAYGCMVRLVSEGGGATPLDSAQAVNDLIEAIPAEITTDDACVKAIEDARAAYDALSEAAQGALDAATVQKLTDAEAVLTALNQAEADKVIAKINNIPTPVELKLATRDSINNARAAYDALNAAQQALVSNYTKLTDAEAALAALNPGGGMPAGALNGKFTINAGGDQIAFSKGNLQATTTDLGANWTWGFAANQWDFIGNAAANNAISGNGTVSANGTVDLFGWSTPTTYYGIHNSTNSDYYSSDFREWGENITGATWKTLSPSDWIYIISNRADAAQKHGQATVNGVNGYIFLPDEWELPTGLSFTAKPNNWTANVYDGDAWTAMENAGAVFLPKSPWRSGNTINTITYGYYWSSDYNNYSNAMAYYFKEDASITGTGTPRYAGICVRLVTADAGSPAPLDSAQAVKDLIEAIPAEITTDDACVKAIEDARAAYDALSEAAQGALDAATVQKLTDAEAAYAILIKAEADAVVAKINNIPMPVELKLATRDSIQNARAAYEALNVYQKPMVTNYSVLTAAEDSLAALNPGVPPATPLDSAQAVKDLIDAISQPVEYPTSGAAIAAALNAYNELSDAAKGALDDADVQKLNDAATQYAALEAIAAIEAIPAEIVYDPAVKAAIETAREKYDALSDASKALVDDEVVAKLTNAEQAWADLVALIEHNVSYMGKDGELKNEKVALLHIPNPAPDFNGYEFVRWDVKAGNFLEEGLRIKAVYTPIITTNPAAYDSLMYNGTAQTLITAGVAKEGHIEYRINDGEWSAELPQATFAAAYVVYYKLVREGHADYIADPINVTITKAPVAYTAPTAVENLVYTASNQTLIAAGQTNDGTFEYSLDPTSLDSWKTALPQAKDAGTYSVYYRVKGDLNHLDSTAVDPIAVTIAKAALTATADDKNVIYGDAVPAYTVTYAGWQGDDDASVLTGDIAFACEYAPTSNVGEYTITPSGVSAANYTITFVNGKVTVAKAESGCVAPVVYDTLVYNGANQTLIIAGQPIGGEMQYSLDTTVLDCWSTSLPQAKDAGTYNVYYRVKGDMNHNDHYYDLISVSIAKAVLTATADDKNVVYGDAVPEYTVSYSGWMGTDEASVLTGTIAFACEYAPTSNVGEYTITPSGVDAANYSITFVNGKVTVAKADLMITADDKNVIYGEVAPAFTASYSGWKNSDDASVVSGLTLTSEYLVTSNVGTYDIVPANASAMNYAISYTNGTLTVNQAALTITANDTTVIYGDEHPEFTVTYAGWKNTDDESVVSGLQFSTPYAPGSYIGTYAINPNSATALNYAITFVDGTLTVNKAHVYVSDAEAQIAKFADGHANAVVLEQGILNGIKLNDPIAHVTTAAFSSADVAENLTITLFYELTGDAALLNNYNLDPTSDIFTNEGVIIEPFIPDNEDKPEDEEAKVEEGIEIYAYGYCDGSGYSLKYHLESGNPDQYKIDFADSRFTDVDWTNLVITGKDGTIDIEIPVDLPTGDYTMTVYFRDSRFDWLESRQFNVTFHVNLPETYVRPLFDNVIALVDTCKCLTDIQWYWRANSTELWQPIEGANGYYYHVDGKLTGEYFVSAKMNGEPTYTCGQTDMETLYGETQKASAPVVKAYPNPVVTTTTVTIENSTDWNHNIRIVNLMGAEVMNATFEGDKTSVEMGNYPQGNYMISVDGIVVKVIKK